MCIRDSYAGDYLLMQQENPDLGFYFPKEGFNLFIDAACIPKGCQNKAAAEAYINFLCDPEISGENLDYLGYSTPISEAKQYMDPETAESEIAYPTEETLSSGRAFINLSEDTSRFTDSLWLQAKTQGSVDTCLLYTSQALDTDEGIESLAKYRLRLIGSDEKIFRDIRG